MRIAQGFWKVLIGEGSLLNHSCLNYPRTPCGVRCERNRPTPAVAALHPGLFSFQPFGLGLLSQACQGFASPGQLGALRPLLVCYNYKFVMTKLLLLSSNTGEGHNSAASAIQSVAKGGGMDATIRRPLEESGCINTALADLYNTLLTRRPQWMTSYLRLIDFLRPNDRDFLYRSVHRFIARFLESERPDVVMSVHPMLNHFLQRFVREARLGIQCDVFVTDPFPPFWHGWASPFIDRYFVVRPEAAEALTRMGVAPDRIEQVPMPVRPQFAPARTTEIEEFRRNLQLDDSSTILINGGARGGGPIARIYQTVRQADSTANIIVICGRNSRLRSRIASMKDPKTRAFGFVSDIHRFIASCDLVLTKPGAMSTYETLACGVPPVLLGILALMPQESGMFAAATQYDFGFSAATFTELDAVIRLGPHAWNRKRQSLARFYRRSCGEEIVERIQPAHVGA
jgi:processive 1,2-diacylglycerol beta-glucosyltransferase